MGGNNNNNKIKNNNNVIDFLYHFSQSTILAKYVSCLFLVLTCLVLYLKNIIFIKNVYIVLSCLIKIIKVSSNH